MAKRRASGRSAGNRARSDGRRAAQKARVARDALRRRSRGLAAFDGEYVERGFRIVAGVDEAGRGALAGPVVSAAVVLPAGCHLPRVYDSKAVREEDREALFLEIVAAALSVGIACGHPVVIDRENILRATLMTMHRAVAALRLTPDLVLVDGREAFQWPEHMIPIVPVVKGDRKSLCVAAASIVAKVTRDRLMRRLHRLYPAYHFDRNKGYGTRDHLAAIAAQGVADVHRQSFLAKFVEKNLSMF